MSMIHEKRNSEPINEISKEKEKFEYKMRPIHYWNFETDGTWELEIHLPGVKKEEIKLKILEDMYDLNALRENVRYTLTEYFPCAINPRSIDARYDNGLLYIKGKIKDPLADAIEIKV